MVLTMPAVSRASAPLFFFFNDTATTEIYTLSLHDALPICRQPHRLGPPEGAPRAAGRMRSEEHTSELQSRLHPVCRLLLEKKKQPPPQVHASHHTGQQSSRTTPHSNQ